MYVYETKRPYMIMCKWCQKVQDSVKFDLLFIHLQKKYAQIRQLKWPRVRMPKQPLSKSCGNTKNINKYDIITLFTEDGRTPCSP